VKIYVSVLKCSTQNSAVNTSVTELTEHEHRKAMIDVIAGQKHVVLKKKYERTNDVTRVNSSYNMKKNNFTKKV